MDRAALTSAGLEAEDGGMRILAATIATALAALCLGLAAPGTCVAIGCAVASLLLPPALAYVGVATALRVAVGLADRSLARVVPIG